ncbi:putative mediator of RNA polymerase II transcription subunit 14 [Antennarius striatus]|uniref:putative mediator of RNA polymerase II transcription subunit 14 n=1 Tax=Antennarius striatus TaxID=241820 RepID=UPI0035ADA14D
MEHTLLLMVTALMIYVIPAVHGSSHLTFNERLEVNITQIGCGTTKLCVVTPSDCDPGPSDNSCMFVSFQVGNATPPNGTEFAVQLSGRSIDNYVAVGLTPATSPDITMIFACFQSFAFLFITGDLNTTTNIVDPVDRRVTDIRSKLIGDLLQCEFNILNVNATRARTADITFNVTLLIRTTGSLMTLLSRGPLNLADPNPDIDILNSNTNNTTNTTNNTNNSNNTTNTSNTTNNTNNNTNNTNINTSSTVNTTSSSVNTTISTTTAIMTTSAGPTGPVHAHAVLILLGVFSLFSMLGA